jgi:uncharacterized protein with FMN-binding domain
MESKSVTLMVRFKDADGKWARKPVARGANGRIKPGHALVDGKPVAVHSAVYELRHIVDRQPVYIPAGKKAAAADAERQKLEIKSAVKAQAKEAGIQLVEPAENRTLKATAAAYIDNKLKSGFYEAAAQAQLVSAEFMRAVKCTRIDEVTRTMFSVITHGSARISVVTERWRTSTRGWRHGCDSVESIPNRFRPARDTRSRCQTCTRRHRLMRCWQRRTLTTVCSSYSG